MQLHMESVGLLGHEPTGGFLFNRSLLKEYESMSRYISFIEETAGIVQRGRPFIKMHGLRNDFIIVDGRREPYRPSAEEITRICDRHEGVGGDELLIVNPPGSVPENADVYAFVRIFNPDGREVEACGNATRCVGWLFMQESRRERVVVDTLGGRLTCRKAGEKQVAVEMGRLRTAWQDIPLAREMDTLHLGIGAGPLQDPVGMNIGNPHAVFFVDDLDAVDMSIYGPRLQVHPLFPEEANIGAAQIVDSKTLKLSVWERPGALTTACGTGACVAVGAAHRRGLTAEKQMTVIMPAGSVEIELQEDDLVVMTGPVEVCFTGYLPVID
jgi:diaminopimelate epimerase